MSGSSPVASGDLQLGAQAGQRGPQLVGGVGDERPLPPAGDLQPGQHVVQGLGQPADLVGRVGHRQGVGRVRAGDLLGAPPQRLDRVAGWRRRTARRPPPAAPATAANPTISGGPRPPGRRRRCHRRANRRRPCSVTVAGPAARATTRTGPSTPNWDPGTVMRPGQRGRQLIGRQCRHQPSAPADAASTRPWSSTTCTSVVPPAGIGSGQPVARRSAAPRPAAVCRAAASDARSRPTRSTTSARPRRPPGPWQAPSVASSDQPGAQAQPRRRASVIRGDRRRRG